MFTIEQIQAAHSKVKSGADFPAYIRDLKALGVKSYTSYVTDGHAVYEGADHSASSSPKYARLEISAGVNTEAFQLRLKEHQQGHTDYLSFCRHCAENGVEKWIVSLTDMTCTYFDGAGEHVLTEAIPS